MEVTPWEDTVGVTTPDDDEDKTLEVPVTDDETSAEEVTDRDTEPVELELPTVVADTVKAAEVDGRAIILAPQIAEFCTGAPTPDLK